MTARHTPVLLQDLAAFATPRLQRGCFIDGTLGAGGYTIRMLETVPSLGRVIGIDRDMTALQEAAEAIRRAGLDKQRVQFVHANNRDMEAVLKQIQVSRDDVDGVMLDLGVSSMQLDEAERGFSFRRDGPLDMRMDASLGTKTALDLIQAWTEPDLVRVLHVFGEEPLPRAKRLAHEVKKAWRRHELSTTGELAQLCLAVYGKAGRSMRKHPATQTFQAIRIAVNDELGGLRDTLESLPHCIRPGGFIGIVTFHSLEAKLVHRTLKNWKGEKRAGSIKMVHPSHAETLLNPRARSATLFTCDLTP